jgi:hypothetical protein
MKRILIGVVTMAMAMAFIVPAGAATRDKKAGKPVQAQTSSCSKCSKKAVTKGVKKDCNKPNCAKTKDGKPCPTDCPKKAK